MKELQRHHLQFGIGVLAKKPFERQLCQNGNESKEMTKRAEFRVDYLNARRELHAGLA